MPAIVIHVGKKQVRMPRLDIERVIALEDRPAFLHNLKNSAVVQDPTLQLQSLQSKPDDTVNGSDSFLNESLSKAVHSELAGPSLCKSVNKVISGSSSSNHCN
jgi:hypothetical protein